MIVKLTHCISEYKRGVCEMYAKIKLYIFCISCMMNMIVVGAAVDKGKERAALLESLGKANPNFREEQSLEEMKCDMNDKGKDPEGDQAEIAIHFLRKQPEERVKEKILKRKTSILASVIYNDVPIPGDQNSGKMKEKFQTFDRTAENLLIFDSETRRSLIIGASKADSPRHYSPRESKDDSCLSRSRLFRSDSSPLKDSARRNSCSNEQAIKAIEHLT